MREGDLERELASLWVLWPRHALILREALATGPVSIFVGFRAVGVFHQLKVLFPGKL
jgi:hypothetical protein